MSDRRTVEAADAAEPTGPSAEPSPASDRRPRMPLVDRIALAVVVVMVLLAVVGPSVAPSDPYRVDLSASLLPPSGEHLLGTDVEGRDVLSRILFGARETLLGTLLVIVVAATVGTVVGTLAAVGPRWLDEILMRVADIGLSLPALILALGFAAVLGPSLRSAVIALAITWWPGYARLVRTVVARTLHQEFVDAARVLGVPWWRLVVRHVLPNSLDALYVQTTIDVAAVALVISGLSFIGVGAQTPSSEWGAMIAAGRQHILTGWWTVVAPGLALAVTAIAFNLAGDALRVRNDPTLREHR